MATSAIEGVLVPGCLALASNSRNSGVTVNKGGYHSTRAWLRANEPNDYSIQLDIDKLGPSDEGSAFDWTFDDARVSDFRTIAKFSNRLYQAGKNHDPRAYPLREFYGNIDLDRDVEGWSFYRDRPGSSDNSHLWHIHFSVWRKYINDEAAMRSILSILKGAPEEEDGDDMPTSQEIVKAFLAAKIDSDKPDFDGWTVEHILDWTARNSLATSRAVKALGEGQGVAQKDLDDIQAALEEHDNPTV